MLNKNIISNWWFLVPALAFNFVVIVVPSISSFYFGLTKWSGFGIPKFTGIGTNPGCEIRKYFKKLTKIAVFDLWTDQFAASHACENNPRKVFIIIK